MRVFPLRRPWREGPRPRGTTVRRPRPGHCAGIPRRTGWQPCAKRRDRARLYGSRHHITTDLLKRSYLALARDAAPGTDGVTWQAYGESLEEKLKDLHDRVHRGSYRARPARRTYIPKADGSKRPLSILCLEDKIVQQAVVYV